MNLKKQGITSGRAWALSKWCSDTAVTLRDLCSDSVNVARRWWEDECDPPEELGSILGAGDDMLSFADRLQAEANAWAGEAGALLSQETEAGLPDEPSEDADPGADTSAAIERIADYFVSYLFDRYQGTRHVRRVATWIGLLLKAIERLAGESLARSRSRQITFEYRHHQFKARYSHDAGFRGGIDIVEVLPGRGAPEGDVAITITSLREADEVYSTLKARLDAFLDG